MGGVGKMRFGNNVTRKSKPSPPPKEEETTQTRRAKSGTPRHKQSTNPLHQIQSLPGHEEDLAVLLAPYLS